MIDPSPEPDHHYPAGRFGFDRDMGATKAMLEVETPGGSGDAVQLTARALTEVKLRFYEPFRRLKIWRQVTSGGTRSWGGTRLSRRDVPGMAWLASALSGHALHQQGSEAASECTTERLKPARG